MKSQLSQRENEEYKVDLEDKIFRNKKLFHVLGVARNKR